MNLQADTSHSRNLPALEELQARDQWVCWRKEQRDKKLTKVPYNPQTGRWARSNDPGTWASYEVTRRAYEHSHPSPAHPLRKYLNRPHKTSRQQVSIVCNPSPTLHPPSSMSKPVVESVT